MKGNIRGIDHALVHDRFRLHFCNRPRKLRISRPNVTSPKMPKKRQALLNTIATLLDTTISRPTDEVLVETHRKVLETMLRAVGCKKFWRTSKRLKSRIGPATLQLPAKAKEDHLKRSLEKHQLQRTATGLARVDRARD